MTINQLDTLFSNIATGHKQINDYFFGEAWQIEEKMNKDAKYPLLFVVPTQSVTQEQVKERTFMFMVMDMVSKDDSNNTEVWSDTEQILDDVIKILRRESRDYEVVGDPVLFPFKEEFSDWATGFRAEITIRTDFNSNYCDVPSDDFVSPDLNMVYAQVIDQDGNVIQNLTKGQKYYVIAASEIQDTLNGVYTIVAV